MSLGWLVNPVAPKITSRGTLHLLLTGKERVEVSAEDLVGKSKLCKSCDEDKDLSMFYLSSNQGNYRVSKCKACMRADAKALRATAKANRSANA